MPTSPERKLTAVLADDTEDIRLLLRVHLQNDGRIEVVGEAGDGERAIAQVEEHAPDLLVLDLAMPRVDGLDTMQRLRRTHPDLKILVLSGFAARHMEDKAIAAGADAYVEKGTSFREITARLLDIAGIVELEDERRTAAAASILEDAAEAARPLDGETLLALIGHELRTPITVLTGLSARLARSADQLDPRLVSNAAEAVERNVRRLDRLVRSFSDLYALDRGQLKVERSAVDFEAFVHDVVAELAGFLQGRDLRVRVRPGWADVDAVRLEQVLVNLVMNAARYTEPGTPIEISGGTDGEHVHLTVRDHGPGVPVADRQRIFRKFARDPQGGGTGLGLYLSRAIVEAHGGTLFYIQPDDGVGAQFVATMPGVLEAPPDVTPSDDLVWG